MSTDATETVLRLQIDATDGFARTGVVHTARGSFRTPCFMPVGTRAAVRTLTSADLEKLGAEVILGNTYHLMLKPGAAQHRAQVTGAAQSPTGAVRNRMQQFP